METEDTSADARDTSGGGGPSESRPQCACQTSGGDSGAPACLGHQCSAWRAVLVRKYLREALPPSRAPAPLVLPSSAPSGHLVLECDVRLPALPYAQEECSGKAPSATAAAAARRRTSGPAGDFRRHIQQQRGDLMLAVRFNDTDRVRQLVSMGWDVNEPDRLGRTPLHVAASQGYADMVELLLRQGARPDPQDRLQNTPLHLAVSISHLAVIQKLLAAGASVWSTNRTNRTAVEIARGKLYLVQRFDVRGRRGLYKPIEELRAVHDLVESAMRSSRGLPADAAGDQVSPDSVLDRIENLSIGGAPSLADVSAELKQMSLTSGGGRPKP